MLINGVEINLSQMDLSNTDLSSTDLSSVDLSCRNLSRANLSSADLSHANLSHANLSCANLTNTNLCCANLTNTNLRYANLCYTNLRYATLTNVDLHHATIDATTKGLEETIIAAEGELIGYKKLANKVICKLLIPTTAKRSNSTSRKCRAEYVVVLEGEGVSVHDHTFHYKPGAILHCKEPFDENRWNECSSGIHFFITWQEASNYNL